MDGGLDPDYRGRVFYSGLFEEQDLYDASIFERKIQRQRGDDYGCFLVVALRNREFDFHSLFGRLGHQRDFWNRD